MNKQWFDVDRAGLGKQAEEHGKGRLIGELVQNALDEAGVTRIDITLTLVPNRPSPNWSSRTTAPKVSAIWPMPTRSSPKVISETTQNSGANSISARSWYSQCAKRPPLPRRKARSSSIATKDAFQNPGRSASEDQRSKGGSE